MKPWSELPENMQNDAVRKYYQILEKHRKGLVIKRLFDICVSLILIIILSPILLILSLMIKLDSKGPVLFRQVRVTQYGKEFRICKFRTMVNDAEKKGTQVTTKNDSRVTRVGKMLRGCRLDELPQLFNVLKGEMTFVGTRPEVVKYVNCYTEEMLATLLLPAGITSQASIEYKDEEKLLENAENADEVYVEKVLPDKMKYNLKSLEEFSVLNDLKTMILTVIAVVK
ncbi:glycosyl transferase [Lachnoclostridium sp. An169]|uniref:sugar transferase n=1 Tax=Lachnoclostridium sp. An169 TaxID=1965569 RepID=UPI000B39C3B3|nr:sugar transferase [Lachnoclostridium sp. An169]OUP86532.1 glycosyl transferase [Lachnoclostridium sp. An169]HJA65286.1 sugar transferase [Candidatus Mediterraneibacter cottocaccae]